MKSSILAVVALAIAGSALGAPNVTNVTQKGSLLIFPDVRIDDGWNTLVRIQNDGTQDVDVICYWMDGNKNRVDFVIPVTRSQAVWFDARSGNGSIRVNRFPQGQANGIDNPFLVTTGALASEGDPFRLAAAFQGDDIAPFWRGPYLRGLLACWAVDAGVQSQIKWNHLSGTATVYNPGFTGVIGGSAAYEYNAYAFFVPTGLDLEPVGVAGTLSLSGVEYDACPLYQIGQFTPMVNTVAPNVSTIEPRPLPPAPPLTAPLVLINRLAIAGCTLALQQDYVPVFTKLQFDVFNEDEVKFTGAYDCADSWHETTFLLPDNIMAFNVGDTFALFGAGGGIDAGAQNFDFATLGTRTARYRVQGVASTQCNRAATATTGAIVTQAVGILAVQSTLLHDGTTNIGDGIGTTLAAAGKFIGRITWDPELLVPEGGIR